MMGNRDGGRKQEWSADRAVWGTAVQTERVKSGGIVNIRENEDQIVGRSWQDFATVIQLSQEVYNT